MDILKDKNYERMIDQYRFTNNNFEFTINTALGTGASFTLPLKNGYTYDCYWDPGDGSGERHITAYNDANASYTYPGGNGIYQCKIRGTCQGWSFNNGGDKLKITAIVNWGNTDFRYLQYGFYGCSNLTSLASDGIKSTVLQSFSYLFRSCGITSIPSNLFSNIYDINDCVGAFYVCPLTSIPSNLFDNGVSINSFNSCFYGCPITSIPDDLFKYNTICTNFTNCFVSSAITSIPIDLFRYNTEVLDFTGVFQLSYSLRNIPENLFYYNKKVTNYFNTFNSCRYLVLPSVLFDLSILYKVTNFNGFMTAASTAYSSTSTIQDIWNYTTATSLNAFYRQTAMGNYASIPNNWKGL